MQNYIVTSKKRIEFYRNNEMSTAIFKFRLNWTITAMFLEMSFTWLFIRHFVLLPYAQFLVALWLALIWIYVIELDRIGFCALIFTDLAKERALWIMWKSYYWGDTIMTIREKVPRLLTQLSWLLRPNGDYQIKRMIFAPFVK